MNLSVMGKISTVFKYLFSSFISLNLFILALLLFLLLLFNIKRKSKYVHYIVLVIYVAFMLSIFIASPAYIGYSIDSFIKGIMKYIYFPSTVAYFFIMLFCGGMLIYSIYSKKLTKFKRIFNYVTFSIMFFLFTAFVVVVTYNKLDIRVLELLYKNDTVLSIVQISNFILFGWIIFTLFYKLYNYFKKNYDKKNED
ncbi:MAG: hypothetical protein IKG58_00405 [Bacilli bacterium]|nr:hypothetical protein [Bacilli bacterium]